VASVFARGAMRSGEPGSFQPRKVTYEVHGALEPVGNGRSGFGVALGLDVCFCIRKNHFETIRTARIKQTIVVHHRKRPVVQ
jgi:hypothetical protein